MSLQVIEQSTDILMNEIRQLLFEKNMFLFQRKTPHPTFGLVGWQSLLYNVNF